MFTQAKRAGWLVVVLGSTTLGGSPEDLTVQGLLTENDATAQQVGALDSSDLGHTLRVNTIRERSRRARVGRKGSEVLQHLDRRVIRRDPQSRRPVSAGSRSPIAASRRADGRRPGVDRTATRPAGQRQPSAPRIPAPWTDIAPTAGSRVASIFTTDFEAGEGFAAGFIDGQVGWSAADP